MKPDSYIRSDQTCGLSFGTFLPVVVLALVLRAVLVLFRRVSAGWGDS